MIIDKNTTKFLYIPRGSIESVSFGTFKLILYSDSTTEDYTFYVEDLERLYDYFKFEVDLEDIPKGEYEWHLHPYSKLDENEYTYNCISRGIIKITECEGQKPEYLSQVSNLLYLPQVSNLLYFEDKDNKIIYYE